MVMTFNDEDKYLHIFDGDHLLLLFISFIRKVYENSNGYKIGAVHTGYAKSGLVLAINKTAEDYPTAADMAVYFEPNGHGSILVSANCKEEFMKSAVAPLFELTNPAIGAGIANIRAVEYMLCQLGWSTKDWLKNSFERCPTRLTKIPVKSVLNYASHPKNEEILIQPSCLQLYIVDTVASFNLKYGNCNVFLRPSGTENYMRLKVDMEKGDDPKALELLVSIIQNGVRLVEILLAEETEMLVVKEDLIKNLEQFVKSKQISVELKQKFSVEPNRIEMLRTTKEEFETEQISMDYCKLYTICSEEQKFVTKSCDTGIGKLIPGLPRRRFGKCNKRLVTEYKRMNSMKQKVERLFEKCLSEKIAFNMPTTETCSKDWPILPEFEREATCIHRVRLVQNHCAKLSRCCSAAQDCRIIVDKMPISTKLIQKEEAVAQASAKCQIKAYNDYLKYKTKRFGDVKVDKRNGGNKNDIRFESNGYHISTSKTPETTVAPTTTPKPLQLFTTRKISLPNRVYPELLHIGNIQPQSQSIHIDDKKLSNLKRIDTSHVKLLWE